ncbi:lysophospholipid acyltransferase family protein [Alienimonas sp. DA493]|uniref:lysophospholipid acyltransferase family protein n=1 Tax=Alienimonas sp. DA493 TaxID=3373605 RepID=UPI0037552840
MTSPSPADAQSPPPQGRAWDVSRAALEWSAQPYLGVRAVGAERVRGDSGGLLLANHQSFLDPIVLGLPLNRSITFVARDSLFRIPVFGRYLRAMKTLPIARDAPATAGMRAALAAIERGELVGLFPEGTRTADGSLGPLKPGFVTLARRSGRPVYPVGIAGAFECLPRSRKLPIPTPGRVRVVFGEPIAPETVEAAGGTMEIVALVEGRIAAAHAAAVRWRETGEEPTGVDAAGEPG